MGRSRRKYTRRSLLLLWLLLTSLLLTTTSYAWFTANRVVQIDTLDIHVQASGGIEISTDALRWKNILSTDDIKNARDNYPNSRNQIPYMFEPVSTGGTIDNNGYLNMYYGITDNLTIDEYILTTSRLMETESFGIDSEGKFIAFDVFFKTSKPQDLYLTKNSKVVYAADNMDYEGIQNAIRAAFLIEGNTTSDQALNVIQNMKDANKAYIWEPNYDAHTEHGIQNANSVYGLNTQLANAQALSYDGVISEITSEQAITLGNANSTNYPTLFKKVNVDLTTRTDFDTPSKIISLSAGVTKVRIYIWIEGQDVDCENNASSGYATFNLQLTTNPG